MEDDERFKHLLTDPRFKNLRKKKTKVQIDDRFKSMFTDEKFTLKYSRDKRGRKDKKTSGDNLRKYYSLEEKDIEEKKVEQKDEDEVEDEHEETQESEPEDEECAQVDDETNDEADEDEEEEQEESEIDEEAGESESEVSSSSDEASDEEDELDQKEIAYDWEPLDHDAEKTEQATRRIAIQNIDWDHFEIRDIYALVNSIRPPMNVKIYVSEFGKERLAKESVEGPQELIEAEKEEEEEKEFKDLEAKMKALQDKNSLIRTYKNNEYEDADECLDPRDEEMREKIRQYQLSRMKYYYAIVEFDSVESAEVVYKELDGMEYEGSSLELDLRFVPDDMEFDPADVKSECDHMSDLSSYKAPQFINTALQQTSVKFTWDETDIRRQEKLSKAYTKAELEKDDLEAYLGSDTDSGEEEEEDLNSENGDAVSVITGNSEARINKYKLLLQSLDEEEKKKKKVDVDVVWGDYDGEEAANESDGAVGPDEGEYDDEDNDDDEDEDVSQPLDDDDDDDDHSEILSRSNQKKKKKNKNKNNKKDKSNDKKSKKDKRKRREKDEADAEDEDNDDLDLLMMDAHAKTNEEFKFDPDDARFKAVYESGLYNIDPSHPNFKRTEAINQIAEKKRQKRQKTTTSS